MSTSGAKRTLIAGLALLAIALGGGGYYAMGTPHYSLFELARAMQRGDNEEIMRFIDVDSLAQQAMAVQLESLRSEQADNPRDQMRISVQARQMRLNSVMFHRMISGAMRDALGKIGSGDSTAQPPDISLKGVTYSGDLAHVELGSGDAEDSTIAFDMRRQEDRSWRIVQADMQQLAGMMQ